MAANAPESLPKSAGEESETIAATLQTLLVSHAEGAPPSQPMPSPIALLDPLQELCPSLDAVQALCLRPVDTLPGGEPFRRDRLHKAILKAASSGDTELISWICYVQGQKLEDGAACPEASAFHNFSWNSVRDEEGTGPVILAASSGHVEAVRILVRHGGEVDERDGSGWTPLMWAINNANLPLVSFLLSQGADSSAVTTKGVSCEDFIISSDAVNSNNNKESNINSLFAAKKEVQQLSSISSDRQLISDLIYEHQQAQQQQIVDTFQQEQQALGDQSSSLQSRLRSMSISSHSSNTSGFKAGSSPPKAALANPSIASIKSFGGHSRSSSATTRRLVGRTERTKMAEKELRARELAEGRRRALLDVAVMLQVDYEDLIGGAPAPADAPETRRSRRQRGKQVHSGLSAGCGAVEVGSDPLSNVFDFSTVKPDQMLVFGEADVEALIDLLIKQARPARAPWTLRSLPANVMFMCLRYAAKFGDMDLQEELMFAFISAVEALLYAHPTELTHLSFWLYNSTLLLHYLKRDKTLTKMECAREHATLLSELVNEEYIFIVRDVERRIDKILQVAVLDHESIPAFDEIRYEDEWSFIKTLRGSVKGLGGGGSGAASGASSPAGGGSVRRPLSQLFAAMDVPTSPRNSINASPLSKSRMPPATASSTFPASPPAVLSSPPKTRVSDLSFAAQEAPTTAADLLARPSPRTITSLLTSVLHVLQLYEINPCIIVQALSQVFFWVGCELFNRIVMHKRYMCKNKAMQIRLNISTLEDWVKTNALPPSLISVHFAKLNQLVSWTLCQSSLRDFDGLISTLQGLRALDPMQLKHVVSEYRYEQGEGRMQAECVQYLDQLKIDWKRRQADLLASQQQGYRPKAAETGHARSGTATQEDPQGLRRGADQNDEEGGDERDLQISYESHSESPSEMSEGNDVEMRDGELIYEHKTSARKASRKAQRDIDSLFEPGRNMNDYVPQSDLDDTVKSLPSDGEGATSTGELNAIKEVLLNSRDMLPFALPSRAETIIVSPGDAFGFGRGHFMGTGTPSLKSMRTDSLLPSTAAASPSASPSPSLRSLSLAGEGRRGSVVHSSRSASPFKPTRTNGTSSPSVTGVQLAAPFAQTVTAPKSTPSATMGLGIQGHTAAGAALTADALPLDDGAVESASQQSGSMLTGTSGVSLSSAALFPQGKGLAAGASWQPVPLLPDGALETLTAVMRQQRRH